MVVSSILHSKRHLKRFVFGMLAVEAALFTFMRVEYGYYGSPLLLYSVGVLACLATYMLTRYHGWGKRSVSTPLAYPSRLAIFCGVIMGLGLCSVPWHSILKNYGIAIASSDIIPALSIYTKRFLANEEIYTPFTKELGYFALPTYLPATWVPYIIPEWLQIDYRWMSILILLIGIGFYQKVVARLRLSFYPTWVLSFLPFALTYATMKTEPAMFGYTVEAMIIGYYFILLSGILLRSWPMQAIGLLLCLLSRFSLVLWVPLFFALVFFQESPRRAVRVAAVVLLGIIGCYIIPFLSHDWEMFMRVQESYTEVAVGEWTHLNEQGLPFHLYNGIGFANLFYQFGTGELIERVRALKTLHLALLLLVVAGSAILYWRQQHPRTDYRTYAVLGLKLYLITFYAFLQVPYAYLASVGIFASMFLVLLVADIDDEPAGYDTRSALQ